MELQPGVGAYETLMNQNMVAQLAQMQQDQHMMRQAREVQAAQNRVAAQNAAVQKAAAAQVRACAHASCLLSFGVKGEWEPVPEHCHWFCLL